MARTGRLANFNKDKVYRDEGADVPMSIPAGEEIGTGTPPAEPEDVAFRTKAEAEEAEKGLLAAVIDTVKEAVGG